MKIALVVPCYNESSRLKKDDFLSFLNANPDFSILFVDDGSKDQTLALLQEFKKQNQKQIEVLALAKNSGKAEAVRLGMKKAYQDQFDLIGYWDADLATPLEDAILFAKKLSENLQLLGIFGSRVLKLGTPIQRKTSRHYLGRIFATCVSFLTQLPVYDSQCGAKLFRSSICPQITDSPYISRWFFDVEILMRLKKTSDPSVCCFEHPVTKWIDVDGSKLKLKDFIRVPLELLKIRRHYS